MPKTGPKTSEGKRRSSMNAIKDGKYARSFFVLRHEDRAEFERLVDKLRRRLQPQDDFEYHLIRQLASIEWRLIRVLHMDTSILDREFQVEQAAFLQAGIETGSPATLGAATHALLENSKLPAIGQASARIHYLPPAARILAGRCFLSRHANHGNRRA